MPEQSTRILALGGGEDIQEDLLEAVDRHGLWEEDNRDLAQYLLVEEALGCLVAHVPEALQGLHREAHRYMKAAGLEGFEGSSEAKSWRSWR